MAVLKNYSTHYWILGVVCLFAFFINNHIIPADLMEARNIATAQEMVSQGNYLVPTLNGELRLEKPPLPTWISALIEQASPGHLALHRYAAGLIATLMVFFMYFFTARLSGRRETGLMAGLILASCYNIVMMGRTATWDIYCHAFMLGAIYFLFTAFEEQGAQWKRLIWAGVLMGLSFLGKGPVSFFALLLPFLIAYIVIYKPKIKGKGWSLFTMIVICLVLSTWWTSYLMLFHKEAAFAVAEKESSSWLIRNVRPWYYYWQFPAEAGIWATFWVTSLIWFYWKKRIENKKLYLFSVLWTFAALILLSAIPEKKPRYLLPMLVPCAISVALYMDYCARMIMGKGERNVLKINTSIIILILFALPVVLYVVFLKSGSISLPLYILISLIGVCGAVWMLRNTFGKGGIKVMHIFYSIIGVMILVEGLCFIPVSKLFINDNRNSISAVQDMQELDNLPFFHIDHESLRMEWVYESNKIIRPLDVTNDSLVKANLPFVLLSSMPADSLFRNRDVTIETIGLFDNNWRQRESRRYNHNLVKHVAIIR